MIFAELHGKLGSRYERAHERGEDLLTSTVFGLLRYIPAHAGFIPILRRVKTLHIVDGAVQIASRGIELDGGACDNVSCSVAFWPSFSAYAEPDVLLEFRTPTQSRPTQILIEAKLFSPKSGSAGEDDDEADEERPDPDQLVRYWHGWRRSCLGRADAALLIYLTPHGAPPLSELEDALRRDPAMRLGWLSWSDLWIVLKSTPDTAPWSLVANDIVRLLGHKSLGSFCGFNLQPITLAISPRFWTQATSANRSLFRITKTPWYRIPRNVSGRFWEAENDRSR